MKLQLMVFGTFLIVALLVIASGIALLGPEAVNRRKLARQARTDYKNARGTAHLALLREAEERVSVRLRSCTQLLEAATKRLTDLTRAQDEELRRALERHIAEHFLNQVAGVGATLRASILNFVFNGRLRSLHNATRLRGIGPARQQAISRWVRQYEARIPAMLEQDFTNKKAILANYRNQFGSTRAEIDRLTKQKFSLTNRLDRIRVEIAKLTKVKKKDFVRAMVGAGGSIAEVDRHIQGLFPEWEPIPAWFKELISTETD